ncbi:MAG: MBOAT family protein [Ruminococcaceae bacterium]|nr:MBOAT family protein [Oscillospiraceae bacterium]
MVFSSVLFLLYFLPVTLVLYFILPKRARNLALFVVSLIFYAWGEPLYISIMLFSTFFDYYNGLMIEKYENNQGKRKFFLVLSVVVNLLILGFFKYSDLFISSLNSVFNISIPLLNLSLPIGISFYTFQTMSYSIDVYQKKANAQKNIIDFGCYVAMFPQLIAGPIVRYHEISLELNKREETFDKVYDGIKIFVCGLSKKVLLANNIGLLWDTVKVLPKSEMSVVLYWLGILAFSFQIYFDFSGYSDMAIGLGKIFGFTFPKNFNYPYISKSITEFWQRWHISLGTWFKEYLYIPLGGNRVKISKNILNLLIVWFATGLWHGASYNFIVWGLYYGILLIIEKFLLKKVLDKLPGFISHIYTLFFVIIGWVLFAFDSINDGIDYIFGMFGSGVPFINNNALYNLSSYFLIFIILVISSTPLFKKIKVNKYLTFILCIIGFIISFAYIVDSSYNPFLYFRF